MTNQHSSDDNFGRNEQRMTELAEAELLSIKKSQALDLINDVDDHPTSKSDDSSIDSSFKSIEPSSPLN